MTASEPRPGRLAVRGPTTSTDDALLAAFDGGGSRPGRSITATTCAWPGRCSSASPLLDVLAALHRRPAPAGRGRGQARALPRDDHLGLRAARERAARPGGTEDWPAFAARNPDLLAWKPSVLEARYYREETLWSERARRVFVLPDRGLTA